MSQRTPTKEELLEAAEWHRDKAVTYAGYREGKMQSLAAAALRFVADGMGQETVAHKCPRCDGLFGTTDDIHFCDNPPPKGSAVQVIDLVPRREFEVEE